MKSFIFLISIVICLPLFSQHSSRGCNLSGNGSLRSSYTLYNTTGDMNLDNFFRGEVNTLRSFFQVSPSFFFYDDRAEGPNAMAAPEVEVSNYPSGTVIYGLTLIKSEFANSRNVTTLPIIMAHEFGHILDFSNDVSNGLPSRTKELFGDFMAGCYLFYRSIQVPTDVQASIRSFYSKGNYAFNSPDFHGTPEDRVNAIMAGYRWLQSVESPRYISSQEAITAAKRYLHIGRTVPDDDEPPRRPTQGGSTHQTGTPSLSSVSVSSRYMTPERNSNGYTYSYTVSLSNQNSYAVSVTVGGLTYGHYNNCDASSYNYVEDGSFDDQTVSLGSRETKRITFSIDLTSNYPSSCSGVKSSQRAKIISIEKDE